MVVTVDGLDGLRDEIATIYSYLGWDIGTTTPTENDTDLEFEILRKIYASQDTSVPKKVTIEWLLDSLDANGEFIAGIGMLSGDALIVDDCNALTGWAVSGGGTNLTLDTTTWMQSTASLNFDMDGASAIGTIAKTLASADDLSGERFYYAWVYVADTTNLTSVDVYISSAGIGTDYYKWTFLTASLNDADWNLLKCDLSSPDSTLGSTVLANINDVQFDVVQSSAIASTDWRLDYIRAVNKILFNHETVPLIEKTPLKNLQYELTITVDNK